MEMRAEDKAKGRWRRVKHACAGAITWSKLADSKLLHESNIRVMRLSGRLPLQAQQRTILSEPLLSCETSQSLNSG